MAHGDAREGKLRGNWWMKWVASTLHTTSEHGVSSITAAYEHTLAASSRLNWRPCWFKWTHPFRRNTKSGFCACAIIFQTQSTTYSIVSTNFICRRKRIILASLYNWVEYYLGSRSMHTELKMTFTVPALMLDVRSKPRANLFTSSSSSPTVCMSGLLLLLHNIYVYNDKKDQSMWKNWWNTL